MIITIDFINLILCVLQIRIRQEHEFIKIGWSLPNIIANKIVLGPNKCMALYPKHHLSWALVFHGNVYPTFGTFINVSINNCPSGKLIFINKNIYFSNHEATPFPLNGFYILLICGIYDNLLQDVCCCLDSALQLLF